MAGSSEVTSDRDEFISRAGRYRPELLAHCYRMLGSLADAEDVDHGLNQKSVTDWERLRAPLSLAGGRCHPLVHWFGPAFCHRGRQHGPPRPEAGRHGRLPPCDRRAGQSERGGVRLVFCLVLERR